MSYNTCQPLVVGAILGKTVRGISGAPPSFFDF